MINKYLPYMYNNVIKNIQETRIKEMSSEALNSLSPYQNLCILYDHSKTIEEKQSHLNALPSSIRQEIAYCLLPSDTPPSDYSLPIILSSDSLSRLPQAVEKVSSTLFQSLPEEIKNRVEGCQQKLRERIEKMQKPEMQKPEGRISMLLKEFDQELEKALEFEDMDRWEKLVRMRGKLIEEPKMIQANKKMIAAPAEPSALDEISPDAAAALRIKGPLSPTVKTCKENNPSIREDVITFIYERLIGCYPEDQLNVCAILYAKFKCSEEEKTCVALLLKESPNARDISGLTSQQIPNYSEAPEEDKRIADAYLSYATQRLFHQFIQTLLQSPPEVPKTALRRTDLGETSSLSYISNLCRDQDPATKESILMLQNLHNCFGDLVPEIEEF